MFRRRKSRKTILGLLEALEIQQKQKKDVGENGGKKKNKHGTESVSPRGTGQFSNNCCQNKFI